jgi:hypothetical protein
MGLTHSRTGHLTCQMTSTSNTPDNSSAALNMPTTGEDRCLAYLDEKMALNEEGTPDYDIATIIEGLLLNGNDHTAVADAARQIDMYYSSVFLPLDPLIKLDDEGMASLLSTLYNLIFEVARLISYKDSRQDTLVELILELRKLPPKQIKIYNVCCVFVRYLLSSTQLIFVTRRTVLYTPMTRFLPI